LKDTGNGIKTLIDYCIGFVFLFVRTLISYQAGGGHRPRETALALLM